MSTPPKVTSPPPAAVTSPIQTDAQTSPTFAPPSGSPPSATPTQPVTPHANPKVAELQSMFPTVEVSVIELVLETCGGSTDRSIEQLLSMTDENFKPDELESVRREEASQVDLDEEFARSLAMQDEQNRQDRGGGYRQQSGPLPPGELPYQPRVRRNRPANQGPDGQWEPPARNEPRTFRDTENPPGMLAVEDKVNRFAEAAGSTFNSFLSRAKAKYSEFQEQQQQRQAENAAVNARESHWGQDSQQSYQNRNPQWTAPGGGRGGQGMWGDTSSYDSRSDGYSRSESFSSESTTGAPQPPPASAKPVTRPSPGRWQPGDTYDDPIPPQRTMSGSRADVGGRRSPGVGSPEKSTGGKIDPAKLGILPKKRVDLLSTSPSAPSTVKPATVPPTEDDDDFNPGLPAASSDLVSKIPPTPPANKEHNSAYKLEDSDDELEYTKNPFDER